MSDTDDTDALLTCDPGGGLQNLLGKTTDGISSQMDSNSGETSSYSSSATVKKSPSTVSSTATTSANNESKFDKSTSSDDKDASSIINVSDYFNSDGELVLPDVSQFLDNDISNDLKSSSNKSEKGGSSGESADYSSDQSSSTVECNTVVPSTSKAQAGEKILNEKGSDVSCRKIHNDKRTVVQKHKSPMMRKDRKSVPREIQHELTRQLLLANKNNPEAQRIIDHNASHISYGVLNLNLNDLKNFAEGMSLCDLLPPSPRVSTYVPTQNDKGEQVYVRAPNFRTPGGYKPPSNPRKCRDLTDEQITEEVRKMYAFPDEDDVTEEISDSKEKTKVDSSTPKEGNIRTATEAKLGGEKKPTGDGERVKVDFNFLDGSPVPNEFGKGKSGKPIKRKLLTNGGNICGGTVGSIPDLGFGLRNLSSDEVKEPLVEQKVTWTTGRSHLNEKECGSAKTVNVSTGTSSGFSFGFGEADTFSPIKPLDGNGTGGNHHEISNVFQSQRMQPSPDEHLLEGDNNNSKQEECDKEFKSTNVDSNIQAASENGESRRLNVETHVICKLLSNEPVPKTKLSAPKRRLIRKAASKYRGLTSPMGSREITGTVNIPPTSSVASDLAEILGEIDIPSDELESLIDNLDDSDIPEAVGFLDVVDTVDGNLVDALSHLKLDNWKSRSDDTFAEKFHNEKIKREQCEKELRNLQESFLTEKQQSAVLEGTLKRRNAMLVQITVAFNRVCKEWTKFDTDNKAAVNKLQRDQKILAAACKHSRDRISHYEKELHDTLEMAESFKIKINDVQKERDESIMLLKETNNELEGKIAKLKESMQHLKNERDATLRALREAQIKLDEDKFTLENMESQLKVLEDRDMENVQKYQELLQAKTQQDSHFMEAMNRKSELESLVINLRAELEVEKSSKDQIKKTAQEEAERKCKTEAERLHEYYNKKVQEIIQTATEEASTAEKSMKDQIKRASVESERRLAECKERFQRELEVLRSKYEAEIDKLKRENLHRQLLISSTVKQLQLGETTNLDVNPLTVQPSRILHNKKDILDALKSQTCQDANEKYKGSGISNITKFTLDQLPSHVPEQHQVGSLNKENGIGQQNDIPFETGNAFVRYKTSTPIDSRVGQHSTVEVNAGGDYRRNIIIGNQTASSDGRSRAILDKVRGEKSVHIGYSTESVDFKNVLSHILEAPVKPEKEQQMSSLLSNGKFSESVADPTLLKCIQDLLKSYSEKLNDDGGKNGDSSASSVASVSVGINIEHNGVNKNEVECSNSSNSETDRNQQLSSTSDDSQRQACHSSRSDSRKSSKAKIDASNIQCSSQLKPPWK